MNPLVIPLSRYNPAQFPEYPFDFAFQLGDITELEKFLEAGRKDVVKRCEEAQKLAGRDDDGIPKRPVWGPVVVGEATAVTDHVDVRQYYLLAPQGMENRFKTTDGTNLAEYERPEANGTKPPPLPVVFDQLPDSAPSARTIRTPSAVIPIESLRQNTISKLYRVSEPIEVTIEEIEAEMHKPKRKNAKAAVYIRGCIVEPKMRVEI